MQKTDAKPLRTALFCAGHDIKEIEAAVAANPDSVVIDLEEPRTPFTESQRVAAREVVNEFLRRPKTNSTLYFVRVQPPETGQTLKDLRAVMTPNLTGVLVPKVQGPADVHATDALLHCMEVEVGLPVNSVCMYPILETAQGIRLAYEIAIASPRVAVMGGAVSRFGDIHQAVGFRWTAEGRETLYLRSKALIDVKAAGIRYPVSGMWGGRRDDIEGLRTWARQLRDLGYYGMMISDPEHVPVVHEIFSPTADELSYWKDLDRLATEAEQNGNQQITYGDPAQGEGFVVHIAHVGSARKNLAWARDLGLVK